MRSRPAGQKDGAGDGRQIVSQDSPSGVSRIGGQAGTQAPTLRPHHRKTTEAGPEALSTVSLPNILRATVISLVRLTSRITSRSASAEGTDCYASLTGARTSLRIDTGYRVGLTEMYVRRPR